MVCGLPAQYAQQPCDKIYTFVGTCHGLICIAVGFGNVILSRNYIVLWNPTTGKSKKLPEFGLENVSYFQSFFGFGFDESCDDYKVVGFFLSLNYCHFDVLVKIYSLKTGVLKTLKNPRFLRMGIHHGTFTFANGKIYWFVKLENTGKIILIGNQALRACCDWGIAYLNLETEEYGMLEKQDTVDGYGSALSMMALSRGSLYVSYYCNGATNIWLVEHGAGITNWTKVIRYPGMIGIPLSMLDNGEIIMLSSGKILIVNPKDRAIRFPEIINPQNFHQGIAYVESLISPSYDNEASSAG